ncbi:polysaccharide biosynthesis protein [Rhizobium sullae]|uniref:Polysaccharide biosynthesis protein n=1 Tax=Rhizobium sullae TaxID=50338 RepID=A0A2N0D1G2_RHISU|nr:oligosaccharide flippase family protein [Rhizobium sullae]PKA39892.1 polysaccharide biosynthesis protein [Rhizobium sullae]
MSEVSVSRSLQNGVIWNSVNAISSQLFGFIIFLILVRELPPTLFGAVAVSAVMADFFANEGRSAGADAILQEGLFDQKTLNASFFGLMVVAVPYAITMVAAAPLFAAWQEAPVLVYFIPIFATLLLAGPWLSVMDALIMRDLDYKAFTQRNLLGTLVGGTAGIACTFSSFSLWALVIQRTVTLLTVLIFEYRRTGWRPSLATRPGRPKRFHKRFFSLWAVAAMSLASPRAIVLIFGARYDGATVGLFRAADRISESIQGPLLSPLFGLWLPLMSKVRGQLDKEREVYTSIISTAAFVSLPAFTGLYLVADDIVALLLPPTFAGVAPLIKAVSVVSLTIPVAWFNPIAFNALNMNGTSLKYTAAAALCCVVTLVLLPPSVSPASAIILMSAPGFVVAIVGNVLLHKRLELDTWREYRNLLPAIVASGAMGFAVAMVHPHLQGFSAGARLGLSVVVGCTAYAGWLTTFHRRWLGERVRLLSGRG